jgi:hypothetical protein
MPKTRSTGTAKSPALDIGTRVTRADLAALRESAMEEARRAGLLDGDRTEVVRFRAPSALVEAARRATENTSNAELGILALAMLAHPDPVAAFFGRTEGRLGPDHELEY